MADMQTFHWGRRPRAWFLSLSCIALTSASCGRPATVEDCERIVARIAELELKEVEFASQVDVKSQIEGTKAAFRDRLMTDCVGRRLRQSTLTCLNKASSAASAINECF